MAFALLRSSQEWETYCSLFNHEHGLVTGHVEWGRGPTQFPCLVASTYSTQVRKIMSCFVYQEDAEKLLHAGKRSAPVAAGFSPPVATPASPIRPAVLKVAELTTEHWRRTVANLMTIIYYLTETKICRQDQYEEKFAFFLHQVDQWYSEQNDEIRKSADPMAKFILERTDPDYGPTAGGIV